MGQHTSHPLNDIDVPHAHSSVRLEEDDVPLELEECSLDYLECRIEKYLFMTICPILITLSLAGNSLTLSVMLRAKLRVTSTAVFIATLAITDTLATVTGLTRHFIIKAYQVDVRALSEFSCVFHRYILYISLDTSSWVLALIAIERFIAVCKPRKYKVIKPASVGLKIIAGLVLLQAAFNSPVFGTRGKHYNNATDHNCGYTSEGSRKFWTIHDGWLVLIWYCVGPFIIMLVLSVLIILRLRSMKHAALTRQGSNLSASGLTKQVQAMTRMLLSVTLYFLIITTPIFVFTMFQHLFFYNNESGVIDGHQLAKLELTDACLTLMLYLNHSINFCLYCLTGRRFRSELQAMLHLTKPAKISNARSRKASVKIPEEANQPDENGLHPPNYHLIPGGLSPKLLGSEVNETNTTSVNLVG